VQSGGDLDLLWSCLLCTRHTLGMDKLTVLASDWLKGCWCITWWQIRNCL